MMLHADLVSNARKHIWFLQQTHGVIVNQESLRRYTELWLPLVQSRQHSDGANKQPMIPPVDVAWLWHCHRLAPRVYTNYCRNTFGQDAKLEATPPFSLQHDEDCETGSVADQTRELWRSKYPNESFFLSMQIQVENESPIPTSDGFDLLESSKRQASFLWQVSGERFSDDSFLRDGVDNYIKFLQLRSKAIETGITLVPTYQIDLMWHTHMLQNLTAYNADCKAIAGSYLHHDDSLTDRSEGGILDVSFAATKTLWRAAFETDYVVHGGMYRGEPPPEFSASDWDATMDLEAESKFNHLIGKIGASSTSPPLQWADPSGVTSTGLPAFIACTGRRKDLLSKEKRDNYVLGKQPHGTGYYHLETKDAHKILLTRATIKIQSLQQDIACGKCFGGGGSTVVRKEKELAELVEVTNVLRERIGAPKPSGRFDSNAAKRTDNSYYNDNGVWLYPVAFYDSCGGACGGGVVCSGGGCGGSACGGGGGCGGGGCGGGGCGG